MQLRDIRKAPLNEEQSDPLMLAAALRAAIVDCPLRRIYPVLGWQKSKPLSSGIGILRMTIVLSGVRHIQMPSVTGVLTRPMKAGEMIVVAPSGWSKPISRRAHRVINIECFPDFTRFVLLAHKGALEKKGDGIFHSAAPVSAEVRALQQALTLMLETNDEARIFPLAQCFVHEIIRECKPWEKSETGLADWQRAVFVMHQRNDIELRRDVVAQSLGVHENHLSRFCTNFTGASFASFVPQLRMERACTYLRKRSFSSAEVSVLAGYHDETHFRKRFKHVFQKTPSAWRKDAG